MYNRKRERLKREIEATEYFNQCQNRCNNKYDIIVDLSTSVLFYS